MKKLFWLLPLAASIGCSHHETVDAATPRDLALEPVDASVDLEVAWEDGAPLFDSFGDALCVASEGPQELYMDYCAPSFGIDFCFRTADPGI